MSDELLTSVADGVMTITLNRPAAKNAVNLALSKLMAAALDQLDSNPDIRAAVLTGEGGTFCSGMDLKAFVSGETPWIEGRGFGGLCENPPQKPLIAAVEGYALAGGLELMLSCDLVVASDKARFGIPEVKRGLVAAAGGLMRLPRKIPENIAMEMALTGDFYEAERMAQLGLVNRVVEAGTALENALKLAAAIAENGPLALIRSKQVVTNQSNWSTGEMWAKQNEMVKDIMTSHDAREGATAFAEKRKPNWKGC